MRTRKDIYQEFAEWGRANGIVTDGEALASIPGVGHVRPTTDGQYAIVVVGLHWKFRAVKRLPSLERARSYLNAME